MATPSANRTHIVDIIAQFTDMVSKKLPVDVEHRLEKLRADESNPRALMIYDTMRHNQELAANLNRPSCQDTGLVQMFARVGSDYPLRDELHAMLKEAVGTATQTAPLRHNTVETFQEKNTGTNTGSESPWVYWEIEEGSDTLELDVYLAGGGCSLPGQGKTLMPGEGYEGAVKFVLDVMTSYGLNACPPLLIGVGIGTSIDSAAYMSKKALMRPADSENPNELVAGLEHDLEEAINSLGLGPQGLGGGKSVMGVNIENSARHPSVLSVALNTGCWSHRRGTILIKPDGTFSSPTHEDFALR